MSLSIDAPPKAVQKILAHASPRAMGDICSQVNRHETAGARENEHAQNTEATPKTIKKCPQNKVGFSIPKTLEHCIGKQKMSYRPCGAMTAISISQNLWHSRRAFAALCYHSI
jgi:hypothetical protein